MPNLDPPVTTVEAAQKYHKRIMQALPAGSDFKPLMTLYLTEDLTPEDISLAIESGLIHAVKYYPKGATTHSAKGVSDWQRCLPTLRAMESRGLPLLIHGEVTASSVDIFDRESIFIDTVLTPLLEKLPKLKVVLEHVSTKKGVAFVENAPDNVAATITAHHLLLTRNDLFAGGLKPHHYCLPVVKTLVDQEALQTAATSGNPKFFLGTDSAPHARDKKECACSAAGIYTAHAAIALYAEVFAKRDALDKLEGFASRFGPAFYNLPVNTRKIQLIHSPHMLAKEFPFLDDTLIPFYAGHALSWQIVIKN